MQHHKVVRCDRGNHRNLPNVLSKPNAQTSCKDALRRRPLMFSFVSYAACFFSFQVMAILAPTPAFSQIVIEPKPLAPEEI